MRYIIIIITILLAAPTNAQVADSVSGKLLYQEMIFWQARTDSARFNALLCKAQINRNNGKYESALNEVERAGKLLLSKKEQAQIGYERMLDYFLSDRYEQCSMTDIDSAEISAQYNEYLLMKLYSLNEAERWTECKSLLL